MDTLNQFHFIRPFWLFGFLFLCLLVVFYRKQSRQFSSWQSVCDPQLLPHLLVDSQYKQSRTPLWLIVFAVSLGLFALAGPSWKQIPQPLIKKEIAKVFVLDLSQSMNATDLKPSRLVRAKHKLKDMLRNQTEGQSALIVYAGDAHIVMPLSDDNKTIINVVNALDPHLMPALGSRGDLALQQAEQLLRQAGIPQGYVFMLTDESDNPALQIQAEALRQAGHRLSILGVGTEQGAPIPSAQGDFVKDNKGNIVIPKLNQSALQQIAIEGGGRYEPLSIDDTDIHSLFAIISRDGDVSDSDQMNFQNDNWQEEGVWLVLFLLPLVLFGFRRGWLAGIIFLTAIPWSNNTYAFEWNELWLNDDQRAYKAYQQQKYDQAQQLFDDSQWRANTHYRLGQYLHAQRLYEKQKDATSQFNQANALAHQGKLEEAIALYDEALKQQPDLEDAQFNKDLLQKLLEQQQSEQEQQDGKQDQQQQQNQDQQQTSDQAQQDQQGQQGQQGQDDTDSKTQQAETGSDDSAEGEQHETSTAQETTEEQEGEQSDSVMSKQNQANGEKPSELSQATQQWLRRIPDDPGGLLREKFRRQYLRQGQQQTPQDKTW